jgi:hypothetical protein
MTTTKPKKCPLESVIEIITTLDMEDKLKLWQWLEQEITKSQQPWLKTAGIFRDDPHFDDVQNYINEYRQEIDEIEESMS